MTVNAVGHPAIRVTHDKTLELTADAAITPRATCVAGVSAAFDAEALAQLRGAVTYELGAGDRRGSGSAVINPEHAVTDRFVIRRSRHADAVTLAVGAAGVAADLPRELAAALAEPGRPVTFTITERQPPPPLVILAPSEPAGRLGALWRSAAVALDLGAPDRPLRARPGNAGAGAVGAGIEPVLESGGTIRAVGSGPIGRLGPSALARLHALVAAGARLACPADPDAAALLAAGLPPVPALHLGRVTGRRLRQPDLQQLTALTACPVVFDVPAEEAEGVAAWLRGLVPLRACWADDAVVDLGLAMAPLAVAADLRPRWADSPDAPNRPDGPDGDRRFVVGPAPGASRAVDLDAVVRHLLDAGVPGRQLADALRPLGLRRSEIYRIAGDRPAATSGGEEATDGGC
ncbi:MAG: DUF371 domain-containing protein [Acidimicrobiales bacterium]